MESEGLEQFVSTSELHSDEATESDPLPPGQVWASSKGFPKSGPGLYRIEVASGAGNGVRIVNQPAPQAFRECVKVGGRKTFTNERTSWLEIATPANMSSRY
jgi:ATP-dependent Lon protease